MSQQYECKTCGQVLERWSPRCSVCQSWITSKFFGHLQNGVANTQLSTTIGHDFGAHALNPLGVERYTPQAPQATLESSASPAPAERVGPVPITEVAEQDHERMLTGIEPLDRVLGGGLVLGSVVLLGGDPGIGKSTLLAQMMASVPCTRLLYATGEETVGQAAMRARRVKSAQPHIHIVAETDVEQVVGYARVVSAQILVVDSIQTLRLANIPSASGSVAQVRECTAHLMRFAKDTSTTTILVGHINKDGGLAGPETLQHLVDVILQFELNPEFEAIRTLRCIVKNRFGGTTEIGTFEMTDVGLRAICKENAPEARRDRERDSSDVMAPIAQELLYRLLELGGTLDDGLLDRIGDRLDLVPRSAP
jgi:predicted ATP-dependent serine protease